MSGTTIALPDFLTWDTCRFELELQTPIILPPFKGSAFRGGLSQAFMHGMSDCPALRCAGFQKPPECLKEQCGKVSSCLYARIFEAPPPNGRNGRSRFQNAPRPYVINPPLTFQERFEKGDVLECTLVLMGPARDTMPQWVRAMQTLGETGLGASLGLGQGKGRFSVRAADLMDYPEPFRIFDGDTKTFTPPPIGNRIAPGFQANRQDRVDMNFFTPLRIKEKKKLVTRLEFSTLFRSLARRLEVCTILYGREEGLPDLKTLESKTDGIHGIRSRLEWHDPERDSRRQNTRMRFGGLMGTISFEGDVVPFLPVLAMGAHLHVGQLTTMGHGWYGMVD